MYKYTYSAHNALLILLILKKNDRFKNIKDKNNMQPKININIKKRLKIICNQKEK